jgi:hypothetical protein
VATFVHNTVGLLAPEAREAGVNVNVFLDRRPVLKVGLWGAWTGGPGWGPDRDETAPCPPL